MPVVINSRSHPTNQNRQPPSNQPPPPCNQNATRRNRRPGGRDPKAPFSKDGSQSDAAAAGSGSCGGPGGRGLPGQNARRLPSSAFDEANRLSGEGRGAGGSSEGRTRGPSQDIQDACR
jgi:hypothetical protein